MTTGPYGRQWFPPSASSAFSPSLIKADSHCAKGELLQALNLYRAEAAYSHIAQRRLNIVKRQIKKSFVNVGSANEARSIALGFIDWFPGFESGVNGFVQIFNGAGIDISICAAEDADILVAGCYGNRISFEPGLSEDKLVILFSGENICPSYDIHDFSVSVRSRSYCGKNVRCPQWLGELSLQNGEILFNNFNRYCHQVPNTRDIPISAIYNNATPEREEVLFFLRKKFGSENIHVFGSQRTGEINKFEVLSRSVINMCFENSIGEGYVTEKLLDARVMGCKALYWGDSCYLKDFNGEGIFNVRDVDSMEHVFEWCRIQLKASAPPPVQWKTVDSSVFAVPPSFDNVYQKLAEWSRIVLAWRTS